MSVHIKQYLQLPLSFNEQKEKVKLPFRDSQITFQLVAGKGCCPVWRLTISGFEICKQQVGRHIFPYKGNSNFQVTLVCQGIPPLPFPSLSS